MKFYDIKRPDKTLDIRHDVNGHVVLSARDDDGEMWSFNLSPGWARDVALTIQYEAMCSEAASVGRSL